MGYASLSLWQTVHAAGATPSIVLTQPADGSTVAGTVSLWAAASDAGFAGVRFLVDGVDLGSEITSGSCTKNWNTAGMVDGSHALAALARTDSGLVARSPDVTVTVSNAAPQIFDVKAWNISGSGASITWYTLQPADAQLDFGMTPYYGNRTALDPTAAVIHTQVLAGLVSGTKYHFRVYSRNALGRRSASPDLIFVTDGAPAPALTEAATVLLSLTAIAGQARAQVTAAMATTPARILNPAASVTATTATITWTTDQPADSLVQYGRGHLTGSPIPAAPGLVTSHSVLLTNLMSGTTYVYRVQSRNAQGRTTTSAMLRFTTPTQ